MALKAMGLISRLPLDAQNIFCSRDEYIQKRNLIAWNFYNPLNPAEEINLVISYDLHAATAVLISTPFGAIHVLSRKDLIEMKKKSARPQDLEDIKALAGVYKL